MLLKDCHTFHMRWGHQSQINKSVQWGLYKYSVHNTYALVSRNVHMVEGVKDVSIVIKVIDVTSVEEDWSMLTFQIAGTGFGGGENCLLFGFLEHCLFTV